MELLVAWRILYVFPFLVSFRQFCCVAELCRNFEPYTEGACTKDSDGKTSAGCRQACLTGNTFDQLKLELGTAHVETQRQTKPQLALGDWTSQAIATTAFRILAEELLGYSLVTFTSEYGNRFREVADPNCGAVNMEMWHLGQALQHLPDNFTSMVHRGQTGTLGRETLYVHQYVPYMSSHYRSIQENAPDWQTQIRTLNYYPVSGSISHSNLSQWFNDTGLEGNYGCDTREWRDLGWNDFSCIDGRWYPPQCLGSREDTCRELYVNKLSWSQGYVESTVKNLGLNFTVLYTTPEGTDEILSKVTGDSETLPMFFWWEPDMLHLKYPTTRVALPDLSSECFYDPSDMDPAVSRTNCTAPPQPLSKLMNAELAASEPDLKFLFDSWTLSNEQVYEMLSFHRDGGLTEFDIEEAACEFLKANTSVNWRPWLKIHSLCIGENEGLVWSTEKEKCVKPQTQGLLPAVIAAGAIAGAIFLIAVALFVRHWRLRNYVTAIEQQFFQDGSIALTLETPVQRAVRILKEVSKLRRVPKVTRDDALEAVRHLLSSNLHAPIVQPGGGAGAKQFEELAHNMIDFVTAQRQVSEVNWSKVGSSSTSMDVSLIDFDDGGAFSNIRSVEEYAAEAESADAALAASIGADLLQDSFRLPEAFGGRPLFTATVLVLKRHRLLVPGRDYSKLVRFLLQVEAGYRDVPYHNSCHAADVLCRLSSMVLHDKVLQDGSSKSQGILLGIMFAAVVHDYGHPGTDNAYQVAEGTPVARRFNHQMVLENSSLYECLEFLRRPDMDALRDFRVSRGAVVELMIEMVLATDMSRHFDINGAFESKVVSVFGTEQKRKKYGSPADMFTSMDEKTQHLCLSMALKIADIGHGYAPFNAHVQWSKRLEEEFFIQGRLDLRAGREPALLKHPNKPGVTDPANQRAFFDVIALPMLSSWSKVFPGSGSKLLAQAKINAKEWGSKAAGTQ
uniref:Phosphodiesterase n=1 Tax=Tetraselmis sp. GSL018 TaxID=582737 RepID=A0A061RFH0_9CHLO